MWASEWAYAGEPIMFGLVLHRAEHAVRFELLLVRAGVKERIHTFTEQGTGEKIRVQLPPELLGRDKDAALKNAVLKEAQE